jgi:hypothetical protein
MIEIIPNILILISLYFVLITILYILYISKSENESIKNNINYLIDSFLPNKNFLPTEIKNNLLNSLNKINDDSFETLDKSQKKINEDLINKSIKYSLIGFSIGIILAFMWCYHFNINFNQILLNNTIIIIFILFVEIAFFYIFKHKYIIADPNVIKNKISNIVFS